VALIDESKILSAVIFYRQSFNLWEVVERSSCLSLVPIGAHLHAKTEDPEWTVLALNPLHGPFQMIKPHETVRDYLCDY
jgi:hypothetical protein